MKYLSHPVETCLPCSRSKSRVSALSILIESQKSFPFFSLNFFLSNFPNLRKLFKASNHLSSSFYNYHFTTIIDATTTTAAAAIERFRLLFSIRHSSEKNLKKLSCTTTTFNAKEQWRKTEGKDQLMHNRAAECLCKLTWDNKQWFFKLKHSNKIQIGSLLYFSGLGKYFNIIAVINNITNSSWKLCQLCLDKTLSK